MSILAKKMSTASSVPASYALLGEQLSGLHSVILENIQPYASIKLKEAVPSVSASLYSSILKNVDDAAPCFVIGTIDQPNLAIIQLSQDMASMISQQKLGAKTGKDADARPLGLLDLVLLQPSFDVILTTLKELLGEGGDGLHLTKRCLSIATIPGIDEAGKWVRLSLPFAAKDGASDLGASLSVELLMSALMADTIAMALHSGDGNIVIDPSDPWATHMHGTVLQSTLPLKVIVEVLNMSVADCTRLELGQTIGLPGASHRHLSVSTESGSGLISLATSTLGVAKSNKAVKLLEDVDASFLSDIATIMQA